MKTEDTFHIGGGFYATSIPTEPTPCEMCGGKTGYPKNDAKELCGECEAYCGIWDGQEIITGGAE